MNRMTRRRIITTGLATAAGVSGLAAAVRIANRYGLISPDHQGILGAGESLTYAAQHILPENLVAVKSPGWLRSSEIHR